MVNDKLTKKEFEKIPLVYLYIYKRLSENTKRFNISYRELIFELNKILFKIPRKYYDVMIKELIDFNLMKKISKGKSPVYDLSHEDYQSRVKELDNLKKSGLRFKIVNQKYEKLFKDLENVEGLEQKYQLLKCDYEKFLRKLELKKLEGSHYW